MFELINHLIFGPAQSVGLSFATFCLSAVRQSVRVSVLAETAPDQYDILFDSALRYTKRFTQNGCWRCSL